MKTNRTIAGLLVASVLASFALVSDARAASREDYEKLEKEVAELRKKIEERRAGIGAGPASEAGDLVNNRFGPDAVVRTNSGKLTLGGLVQVWYYYIENDNHSFASDFFRNNTNQAFYGSNEVADNDSFRIRRAELRFTMDITENVTGVVMIDPAREALSFPSMSSNLSTTPNGVAFFNDASGSNNPLDGHVNNDAVRNGTGDANRLLQEAYINMHGVLPHHDTTIGHFRPKLGEEGPRDSSQLDFVERAMITQIAELRDLGSQLHGTWWDDRFQYWLGIFGGAGTAFQQRQNRSDDNDKKDYILSALVRPIWKEETWGSMELGFSFRYGKGGEGGGHFSGITGHNVDGLNLNKTKHTQWYAWFSYHPGGPVRGWWVRGEWGQYKDRFAPGEIVGQQLTVTAPAPFTIEGWYAATGYRLDKSVFADSLRDGGMVAKILYDMEFVFRYERMQNLFVPDVILPQRRFNIYHTEIFTAGVNWRIKGDNAKIQINYNWVGEEDDDNAHHVTPATTNTAPFRSFTREVNNNNLVVNFQVAW